MENEFYLYLNCRFVWNDDYGDVVAVVVAVDVGVDVVDDLNGDDDNLLEENYYLHFPMNSNQAWMYCYYY